MRSEECVLYETSKQVLGNVTLLLSPVVFLATFLLDFKASFTRLLQENLGDNGKTD